MAAQIFRAPASKIHQGGQFSLIQDGGRMHGAGSVAGNYVFTEVGAGVKPLVLIGDIDEILHWLMDRKEKGIDNQIPTLPEVYMSVEPYKPKPRFVGLFPFHDTIQALIDKVGDLVKPDGLVYDALETGGKAYNKIVEKENIYQKALHTRKTKKTEKPEESNRMAVTWSYLPGHGLEKIGEGFISFGALYWLVEKMLLELHGVTH